MTEVIHLQEDDDLAVLRSHLRQVRTGRAVISLPWDAQLLSRGLDCELVRREAGRLGLEVAVVSPDPDRRSLVRQGGLVVFSTAEDAQASSDWRSGGREEVGPAPKLFWEEDPPLWPPPEELTAEVPERVREGGRWTVFVATLLIVLVSAYIVVPQASITLVPWGETVTVIVPVSAGVDVEAVDTGENLIPARRVGDYFEGYIEVETSGTYYFQSGRSTGSVLFTNLLAQDVLVPVGTALRTSAGSFPVRFTTTAEVTVPGLGQASAPIEAVNDGPVGNVGVNQINQVEGVAGLALRVTNPEPTVGGSADEMRSVSEDDMERAGEQLAERMLAEAHEALQLYLEPTEFVPRQSLQIQSTERAYNRFLHERADTLGLHMRLLISGLAVDQDNAEAVAYAGLVRRLPAGYELVGAMFEIGEEAEEPISTGDVTFFATATGYASAQIDPQEIRQTILGRRADRAAGTIEDEFPLRESPQITIWPEWFPWMPLLPVSIDVRIIPRG